MRHHLILVRHAKSSWDDYSLRDFERPLSPRGTNALPKMAAHLTAGAASPDLVLCSAATRTRETFAGLRGAIPDSARVEYLDVIYGASTLALLDLVRGLPEAVSSVMVVGHNPGTQDLALTLAGSGDADLRHQLVDKYPTGAIATLSFDGTWAGLGEGHAHLDDFFMPRRPRS